jgi:hypothetical protein
MQQQISKATVDVAASAAYRLTVRLFVRRGIEFVLYAD